MQQKDCHWPCSTSSLLLLLVLRREQWDESHKYLQTTNEEIDLNLPKPQSLIVLSNDPDAKWVFCRASVSTVPWWPLHVISDSTLFLFWLYFQMRIVWSWDPLINSCSPSSRRMKNVRSVASASSPSSCVNLSEWMQQCERELYDPADWSDVLLDCSTDGPCCRTRREESCHPEIDMQRSNHRASAHLRVRANETSRCIRCQWSTRVEIHLSLEYVLPMANESVDSNTRNQTTVAKHRSKKLKFKWNQTVISVVRTTNLFSAAIPWEWLPVGHWSKNREWPEYHPAPNIFTIEQSVREREMTTERWLTDLLV